MILQVLFYAELETFVLKCKFNSKSLAPVLKISGCATVHAWVCGNCVVMHVKHNIAHKLLHMYLMLYASRLFTIPKRSLISHAIFSQTGLPRRVDGLAPFME